MKNTSQSEAEKLRQKAKEILKNKPSKPDSQLPDIETKKLIHELEVHQIELELQNEDLIQANEQASIAAEKYLELYDFAPSGYFTLSKTGEILELNLTGAKMMGKDRSQLKKRLFHLHLTDESKTVFLLFLEKVFSGQTSETCEVTLIKDGEPLYVLLTGIVTDNEELCNATMVDITGRKKAEEKVKRYSRIFEDTLNEIYLFNSETLKFIQANNSAQHNVGYTMEELIAMTPLNLIPEFTPEFFEKLISPLRKGEKEKIEFETVHQRKDKSLYNVEVHLQLLKFEQNELFAAIILDITEHKQAEEALKESKAKYQKDLILLNSILESPVSIIIFSLDINYCYTSFTKSHKETIKQIWGVDILPGMNMLDVILNPEDREKAKNNFDRVLTGEYFVLTEEYGDETLLRTFYENYYNPIKDTDGKVIGISVFVIDVTKRKKAELKLQENESRLSEINAQKDKFFSIIAHDLKSPFNSIMGFSSLLAEQVRKKNYANAEKYAEIIEHSSNRAIDLLMNLMEWSRSQTGRMVFSPEYVEMLSLIDEITPMFEDIAGQKGITIHRKLPPNAPVFADKAMISTILRNLISNAIKFSHPGGEIIISTEKTQNELRVLVKDNGVGIPKDSIEKLFRVDEINSTSGTKNEKGTGLGLILCKEFVEKNNGKIWVESEVGKGSTFYFTLSSKD